MDTAKATEADNLLQKNHKVSIELKKVPENFLDSLDLLWKDVLALIDDSTPTSFNAKEATWQIRNAMHKIVNLLIECSSMDECSDVCRIFCSKTDVFMKIYGWTGRHRDCLRQMSCEQLAYFVNLVSMSGPTLLTCSEMITPMLLLLLSLKPSDKRKVPPDMEELFVKVLYVICQRISISSFLSILSEDIVTEEGFIIPKFTFFELLIMYTHQTGQVGEMAREGIVECMKISRRQTAFLRYLSDESAGCVVIAGGLSARYSSLPTTFEIHADDWHQIGETDIQNMTELRAFLKALDFCCDVMEAVDKKLQRHLAVLIHDGFLMSVLAPALNQTLVDAQVAVIAYLELFLRRISNKVVMEIFLKVLLTDAYDNKPIIDVLILHITSSNAQLAMVTMQLFKTLLDLNCEDVMFHLVLRYLLPCNHILPNQKRTIKELDFYCKSAAMFLYLTPGVCLQTSPDVSDPVEAEPTQSMAEKQPGSVHVPGKRAHDRSDNSNAPVVSDMFRMRSLSIDCSVEYWFHMTVDFMAYLSDARDAIAACKQACLCWSAVYDGMDVITERSPRLALNSRRSTSVSRASFSETLYKSPSVSTTDSFEMHRKSTHTSQDYASGLFHTRPTESLHLGSGLSPGIPDMSHVRFPTECLGPFMNALFDRLEEMMESSVYVNLQLTGLLSRLACYPQLLLRSFLLNSNLVIRPGVRSFTRVLMEVSDSANTFMQQVDDYRVLIARARRHLASREFGYGSTEPPDGSRSGSLISEEVDTVSVNTATGGTTYRRELIPVQNGSLAHDDITSLNGRLLGPHSSPVGINTSISKDNRTDRSMTVAGPTGSVGKLHPAIPRIRSQSSNPVRAVPSKKEMAAMRKKHPHMIKNVVYCVVVLEEFVKEIAAIAMEQVLV